MGWRDCRRMRSVFSWRGISEQAVKSKDHSGSSVAPGPGMVSVGQALLGLFPGVAAETNPDHADAPDKFGRARICTRFRLPEFPCSGFSPARCLASMLAEGTPVRAKDLSQSWDEGPRMLPSRKARPGHREQLETWVQDV